MVTARTTLASLAAGTLLLSTPLWLPRSVVALRMKVFARVNGDEGITFPNAEVGPDRFEEIYGHPAADGRSRGAALSDLFWYWLAPGADVHQEHLEAGPRYDEVARTTLAILGGPSAELYAAAARCTARVLDERVTKQAAFVRLRDLMMPVWAEFFYGLVFKEPCPPHARRLIVDNAEDVVNALKCTRPRHLARRTRLTRYLSRRIAAGHVPHRLPASLTEQEHAFYLQGTFFNTAVVQMSEAMAHLLLAIAQHPDVQDRLTEHTRHTENTQHAEDAEDAEDGGQTRNAQGTGHTTGTEDIRSTGVPAQLPGAADDRYLGNVMNETFRLYPLFGVAHRITTGDIDPGTGEVIPAGSVLCFSYPDYHATGYTDPNRFDPDRWETLSAKDAHHIPFGVAANRSCPAWRLAPLIMRAATREVLKRFVLDSPVSHTRSIPHRAPCLLTRRERPLPAVRARSARGYLRLRDHIEDVGRSTLQLGLGSWMVLQARRERPATTYFAGHDTQGRPLPSTPAVPEARCPYTGRAG